MLVLHRLVKLWRLAPGQLHPVSAVSCVTGDVRLLL